MTARTRLSMMARSQSGVAMVTVLFVGSALTAVASMAAYTTIQELQAANDDRKAAASFSYAESGVDRLILELRRGKYTWGDIREAGCQRPALTLPDGVIGNGTYDVEMVAFDPLASTPANRFPIPPTGGACAAVADTSPRSVAPHYFAVTSTGQHPAARRVIRYVVVIKALNLPIGVYAESAAASGTPNMNNISMLTPGDVTGREKLGFTGLDPYYKVGDFWTTGFTAAQLAQPVPAAIHAVGHIFLKNLNQANNLEHRPGAPMNCTANKPGSPVGQSMWDQSGDGGVISGAACAGWLGSPPGPPPTSLFTKPNLDRVTPKPSLSDQDYLTLRDAAKQTGLYCFVPTTGVPQCTRGGTAGGSPVVTPGDVATPSPIPQNNFVAYFDFENALTPSTNLVSWTAPILGCNPTTPGRSVVIIIRNGSMRLESGIFVNGAFIAPEGTVELQGGATLNGTVIAKRFQTNGNPTIQLNECWVNNMPGPFLDVAPFQWSEIDR